MEAPIKLSWRAISHQQAFSMIRIHILTDRQRTFFEESKRPSSQWTDAGIARSYWSDASGHMHYPRRVCHFIGQRELENRLCHCVEENPQCSHQFPSSMISSRSYHWPGLNGLTHLHEIFCML